MSILSREKARNDSPVTIVASVIWPVTVAPIVGLVVVVIVSWGGLVAYRSHIDRAPTQAKDHHQHGSKYDVLHEIHQ
jgi:hypothetical protein